MWIRLILCSVILFSASVDSAPWQAQQKPLKMGTVLYFTDYWQTDEDNEQTENKQPDEWPPDDYATDGWEPNDLPTEHWPMDDWPSEWPTRDLPTGEWQPDYWQRDPLDNTDLNQDYHFIPATDGPEWKTKSLEYDQDNILPDVTEASELLTEPPELEPETDPAAPDE